VRLKEPIKRKTKEKEIKFAVFLELKGILKEFTTIQRPKDHGW